MAAVAQDAQSPNAGAAPSQLLNPNQAQLSANATNASTSAAHLDVNTNTQQLDKSSFSTNQGATGKSNADLNRQGIPQENLSSNQQAIPTQPATGANLQGLPSKGIHDNYVKLPPQGGLTSQANSPTSQQHPNLVAKSGAPVARSALTSNVSHAGNTSSKAMDEFHGRLKGIKQEVDVLNNRLTKFEEQIHKKPVDE
jgi:hypothetical protein